MMRIAVVIFFLPIFSFSQTSRIDYERKVSWSKIAQSQSYLSKEEKDRISLTWGRDKSEPLPYILLYDNEQAIYTIDKDNLPSQEYNWRREKFIVHTNYVKKRKLDNIELLGKSFLFDEDLPKIKWKILNEIKEVAGYVCMKAETFDSVKNYNVVVWFSSEIPISLGPENYYGLPGLILEVDKNNGCAIITATKIALNSITTPIKIPKKKGKKTSIKNYNALLSNHIKESIQAQRNPFWGIPY
ncbi:MAG: GLPGLI family protein [Saprospiraceae bacterium]